MMSSEILQKLKDADAFLRAELGVSPGGTHYTMGQNHRNQLAETIKKARAEIEWLSSEIKKLEPQPEKTNERTD